MKTLSIFLISLNLILMLNFCKRNNYETAYKNFITEVDTTGKILIADTIIYDVIINKKKFEDTWQDESLKNFKHQEFINYIFYKIYNHEIIPLDYITSEPIPLAEIKKLEKTEDFERGNLSRIQFQENWYIDTATMQIEKKIISIILAYSIYDNENELRGYKAAFKINY